MLAGFLGMQARSLKLIKRRANIYSIHILGGARCIISACRSLFGFLFVVMCGLQPCLMQTLNNQSVPFFCVEAYSQESNYYNVNTCCNIGIGICADITWLSTLLTTNWLVTTYGLPFRANVPNVEPLWFTRILVYCSRQFRCPFLIFCNFKRCSLLRSLNSIIIKCHKKLENEKWASQAVFPDVMSDVFNLAAGTTCGRLLENKTGCWSKVKSRTLFWAQHLFPQLPIQMYRNIPRDALPPKYSLPPIFGIICYFFLDHRNIAHIN